MPIRDGPGEKDGAAFATPVFQHQELTVCPWGPVSFTDTPRRYHVNRDNERRHGQNGAFDGRQLSVTLVRTVAVKLISYSLNSAVQLSAT